LALYILLETDYIFQPREVPKKTCHVTHEKLYSTRGHGRSGKTCSCIRRPTRTMDAPATPQAKMRETSTEERNLSPAVCGCSYACRPDTWGRTSGGDDLHGGHLYRGGKEVKEQAMHACMQCLVGGRFVFLILFLFPMQGLVTAFCPLALKAALWGCRDVCLQRQLAYSGYGMQPAPHSNPSSKFLHIITQISEYRVPCSHVPRKHICISPQGGAMVALKRHHIASPRNREKRCVNHPGPGKM
jgi:hypothetical protein